MALPEVPKLNYSVALTMTGAFPVEGNSFFKTYAEAVAAAATAEAPGSTATVYYFTQILHVTEGDQRGLYEIQNDKTLKKIGGGSESAAIKTDDSLSYENGILSVNTADKVEEDNTLPITAAAVHAVVGNIEILLETI